MIPNNKFLQKIDTGADFDVKKDGWRLIILGEEIEQGNRHYKGQHDYLIQLENDGKTIYGRKRLCFMSTELFL